MDRYDRVIRDVQQRTSDETIHWKAVNADRHSDVLLNPHRVIRAFEAAYPVAKEKYELLFLERRVDFFDEFGGSTGGYGFELLILDDDGQIVLSLYDGVVDRDDLLKLSGLIDTHNDRVKNFFNAFDEAGAV